MKYRFVIEYGPRETLILSEITPDDETGKTVCEQEIPEGLTRLEKSANFAWAMQEIKRAADDICADGDEGPLKWKDAPPSWQPDTILVSQWFDDGVKENRDS